MVDYKTLLQKAQEEMPLDLISSDRFTVESVKGHIEGTKTVVINLHKIAKTLERDVEHLFKYLLRETASSGKLQGSRALFGSKIPASRLNRKVTKYMSEFVFCSECSKPDTSLVEERNAAYLKCQACGAKKPVKRIK